MPEQTWEEMVQGRRKDAAQKLLAHIPTLTASGIAFVVGFFNGDGDSGSMEGLYCFAEDRRDETADMREHYSFENDANAIPLPEGIKEDDLYNLFEDLTPDGYEEGLGGFGAVIFDAINKKIKVNYNFRTEDSTEADFEVL